MELGKFKTIALRKKWPNEASDFTPWLANNIDSLSEEIGIELEIENTEVAVGPYSADILAKDAGTGTYVVIENQLEKTNHDHLGKSITYASVLDASIIIWVASEFTEEHKKALDWLNDHTDENLSFYGIQVELWQIDESKPAVKFNVICKPNLAVRQAAKSKTNEELSENRKFQYNFWIKLRESLIASKKIPSVQTPRPQYWFDVSLGKANIHISNTCNTEQNIVGIRVYISNRISDSMLPYLENRKEEIELKIGQKLEWNPNPDNRDKVIVLTHATDFSDDSKVDEAIKWLTEYTIKFRDAFGLIIKDLK
jgi:hypothetical protein